MRWREGLACPACGHRGLCALKTRKLFQCNRCKKQVRLTAGTVFQDTKLPLTAWFTAIYHLAQGRERDQLDRARAKARGQAADSVADQAQADAGDGRARGRKAQARGPGRGRRRLPRRRAPGRRSVCAAGKTPIVAAVETTAERRPKRLRLSVVKGFRKKEVKRLAERDFAAGSNIVSDEPVLLAGG